MMDIHSFGSSDGPVTCTAFRKETDPEQLAFGFIGTADLRIDGTPLRNYPVYAGPPLPVEEILAGDEQLRTLDAMRIRKRTKFLDAAVRAFLGEEEWNRLTALVKPGSPYVSTVPDRAVDTGPSLSQMREALLAGVWDWKKPSTDNDQVLKTALAALCIAQAATQDGHGFELQLTSAEYARVEERCSGIEGRVPYAVTPIFLTGFIGQPVLLACVGDANGNFHRVLAYYPEMGIDGRVKALRMCGWAGKNAAGEWQHSIDPTDAKTPDREAVYRCANAVLALIADDRQPIQRIVADEKLNKARQKKGKPPIPARWALDHYVTELRWEGNAQQRPERGTPAGTHASPRPHDRRGHNRHLPSGKVVWVRPCHIGVTLRHLTRGRDFYRIAPLARGENR